MLCVLAACFLDAWAHQLVCTLGWHPLSGVAAGLLQLWCPRPQHLPAFGWWGGGEDGGGGVAPSVSTVPLLGGGDVRLSHARCLSHVSSCVWVQRRTPPGLSVVPMSLLRLSPPTFACLHFHVPSDLVLTCAAPGERCMYENSS